MFFEFCQNFFLHLKQTINCINSLFLKCKKENFVNSKNKIYKAYVINLKKIMIDFSKFIKNTKEANIRVDRLTVYGKDEGRSSRYYQIFCKKS